MNIIKSNCIDDNYREKITKIIINTKKKKLILFKNIIFENFKIRFVKFCEYQYQYCNKCLQTVDMTNLETYSNFHDSVHKTKTFDYYKKCNNCNFTCEQPPCNCDIKTFFSIKDTIV